MLVRFLKSFTPNTFINTQHIKTIDCYYGYNVCAKRRTPDHPQPEGDGVFNPEYLKRKELPDYFQKSLFYYDHRQSLLFYYIDEEGKKLTPEEFIGEERLNKIFLSRNGYDREIIYNDYLKEGSALYWECFIIVIHFSSVYPGAAREGTGGAQMDSMDICFNNIDDCIEAAERLKRIMSFEEI